MNSKQLFVVMAAASLVATLMLAPVLASATNGFLHVIRSKIVVDNTEQELEAKFVTESDIPKDGSGGAFGYGVLTSQTDVDGTVLVTTTHGGVLDSEDQSDANDPEWHNHYVRLAEDTDGHCDGLEVVDITWESPGRDFERDNRALMGDVPMSFTGTHSLDRDREISFEAGAPVAGVSFTLEPVFEDDTLVAVCVNDVTPADKTIIKEVDDEEEE